MPAAFLDTSVFLTAMGRPTPSTLACQQLIARGSNAQFRLHTAAECIQEVVFHRMRLTHRDVAIQQGWDIRDLCIVHPMDDAVINSGLELLGTTAARGRDAFIAATALLAGFDHVVTTDERFVEVPGLRRLSPRDVVA